MWRCRLGALAVALSLSGCSMAKVAVLALKPLDGFESSTFAPAVHYEPGAQAQAEQVGTALAAARRQVEAALGSTLPVPPEIYLCADQACYQRYAYTPGAAAETRPLGKVVVMNAGKLAAEGRLIPVLTHELTHAYWHQRGLRCFPRWWAEGLAVDVSGGGGAEKAPQAEAIALIRAGKVFQAIDESCWVRDSQRVAGLEWPMFYRQAGMFVGYLRHSQAQHFARTLELLRDGSPLFPALETAYGQPVATLWTRWQSDLTQTP